MRCRPGDDDGEVQCVVGCRSVPSRVRVCFGFRRQPSGFFFIPAHFWRWRGGDGEVWGCGACVCGDSLTPPPPPPCTTTIVCFTGHGCAARARGPPAHVLFSEREGLWGDNQKKRERRNQRKRDRGVCPARWPPARVGVCKIDGQATRTTRRRPVCGVGFNFFLSLVVVRFDDELTSEKARNAQSPRPLSLSKTKQKMAAARAAPAACSRPTARVARTVAPVACSSARPATVRLAARSVAPSPAAPALATAPSAPTRAGGPATRRHIGCAAVAKCAWPGLVWARVGD
jgi:hypothetical protein